jgi:hypothetical protein
MPPVNNPSPEDMREVRDAVARCARDEEFFASLRGVYERVDAAVAAHDAACMGGGACCKFEAFGHRLYVSAGELAMLTESPPPETVRDGHCPYQVGPRCTARRRRPLGCRVFFCDPAAEDWSTTEYERFHAEIRDLHERHNLPYAYVELVAGLRSALQGAAGNPPKGEDFCVDSPPPAH